MPAPSTINTIYISKYSAYKFYKYGDTLNSYFNQSLPNFLRNHDWFNPVNLNDLFRFQIGFDTTWVDTGSVKFKLCDIYTGEEIQTFYAVQFINYGSTYYFTFGGTFDYVGKFYIKIYCNYKAPYQAETITLYSEPIHVKTAWENTILITSTNTQGSDWGFYYYDFLGQEVFFTYRIFGGFLPKGFKTKSMSNVYINADYQNVQLSGQPHETQILTVGKNGIPNYVAKNINQMLLCDSVDIDGKYYCRTPDSSFDVVEYSDFEGKGNYNIELQEKEDDVLKFKSYIPETIAESMVISIPGTVSGHDVSGGNITIAGDYSEITTPLQAILINTTTTEESSIYGGYVDGSNDIVLPVGELKNNDYAIYIIY